MKFEIYNGRLRDSFIVEAETREECERITEAEMKLREWEPEDTSAMEIR